MSNSRLEKFIYAICGMEVDDLPTPLSRIETLWNCLITGETPDFEPLSRNEKYLMSMLTGDVDALPEPTSRSEKLLYKIATGETDLTDVPGYSSRYEELLKYLIENGGFGGTDFEYVLYTLNDSFSTLYTTAEGPVKSAILKGCTLVNLIDNPKKTITSHWGLFQIISNLKANTDYTISIEKPDVQIGVLTNTSQESVIKAYTNGTFGFNTQNNTSVKLYVRHKDNTSSIPLPNEYWKIVMCEGDYTNQDIPYFEGMQSVKMPVLTTTGKNLFNPKLFESKRYTNGNNTPNTDGTYCCYDIPIEAKYGDVFRWSTDVDSYKVFIEFDENGNQVYYSSESAKVRTYTVKNSSTKYIKVQTNNTVSSYLSQNPMLEKEPLITIFYEPYKSNILTVNEDVTLRGIGDVQDTLDCLTGEVTERIGEIVLDGSEDWVFGRDTTHATNGRVLGFKIQIPNLYATKWDGTKADTIVCDKLKVTSQFNQFTGEVYNSISQCSPTEIQIMIKAINNSLNDTLNEIKRMLSENPVTVVYPVNDVIKTVVLSTLDQDGQPTKLSTFNDITHVTIEAEDLLPAVDLEVATKIEETLSSLPTQMIDISETQQSLNEKIDEQAENIKEVSAAMIEIRNDIL